MSSSIFFRFKSQKDPLQITFDGTSLSVFEVKREIIGISKLGDGTDFDLEIYTPESMEKYDDDTTQIPRSTTVIARRLPAAKQGAGRAARYVTGKMPITAKNQHRVESAYAQSTKSTPISNGATPSGKEMTEEEKLAAMFTANNEAWKQDQAQNAGKPIIRSSYNKQQPVPDKPLPPGYTCHRCGEKGHWIQACPTNNDPTFDGRPKFRRTTGIPRSMLKVIEKPTELGEDGKVDVSKLPPGVMYTATGEWVIAQTDKAAWDKFQEQQKATSEKTKEAAVIDQELRDRGLECSIDQRAFVSPVKTPCCGKTYCKDCVENAILDTDDLHCPNCGEQVLLDKLEPDEEMGRKVKEYQDEKKAAKLAKDTESSKSPAAMSINGASPAVVGTPKADDAKSPAPDSSVPEVKVNGTDSAASTPSSRKRGATEELDNNRKPTAPAAMMNGKSKQGTPIPTGPKAGTPQQPPTKIASNMQDFAQQMQSMASGMSGMQNGMNATMNPMMNPMMSMGMGMPMNMGMMNPMMGMGGMPGFGMNGMGGMNGMQGMQGMNGMGNMGNMGNMGMYNNGMQNGGGWGGQQQGWGGNQDGMQGNGQGGGAYMRQPVNPHRHQGRQRRQRSVDYKQMGSG